MKKIAFVLAVAVAVPAGAQSARELRDTLSILFASEEPCELSFKHDAIADWVDQHVDPADMRHSTGVAPYVSLHTDRINAQGQSERVAHCRAIERTARHFGFIE